MELKDFIKLVKDVVVIILLILICVGVNDANNTLKLYDIDKTVYCNGLD